MEDISPVLKSVLIKNGLKEITGKDFAEKLYTCFGIKNNDESLIILPNQKGYSIDTKNRFINTYPFEPYYIKDFIMDEGQKNEYTFQFVNYNKIIFQDDPGAIANILNEKDKVTDMYFYFDYEKNAILNNLALRGIDYENWETDYLQHLFFYNNKERAPVKFNVISYMVKHCNNMELYFLDVIETLFNFWDRIYSDDKNKYTLIAFLTEQLLEKYEKENKKEKSTALIQYLYSLHEILPDIFIKESYFKNKLLGQFSTSYIETEI